jgi:indolepyruvate ferredoxin oxidoreductase beta subunit
MGKERVSVETINFLITGVGGQGTILASDILAAVGLAAGHDVKKSDILGLAVRGGGGLRDPGGAAVAGSAAV